MSRTLIAAVAAAAAISLGTASGASAAAPVSCGPHGCTYTAPVGVAQDLPILGFTGAVVYVFGDVGHALTDVNQVGHVFTDSSGDLVEIIRVAVDPRTVDAGAAAAYNHLFAETFGVAGASIFPNGSTAAAGACSFTFISPCIGALVNNTRSGSTLTAAVGTPVAALPVLLFAGRGGIVLVTPLQTLILH
jgi:hypothetical protein